MENGQAADLDLKHYVLVVWRWLWLIILAAAIAGGGAFLVSSLSTPIYEASTTLMIREGQKAASIDYNAILISERLARTYSQMLKDTPVLDETIARLGLGISEEALAKMLTVENVRDTLLINVKVRNADPVLATDLANTIVEVFAEHHAQVASASYSGSMENLDSEIRHLQGQIQASQQALDAQRAKPTPDAAEVARLETMAAQYRSTYAELLRSYEEMRVSVASATEALVLTKAAKVPATPILPRRGLNTALAGAVGALLGLGAAFLFDYLDDRIKGEDDVQGSAQLPVLAKIPRFGRAEATKGLPLMAAHPESAVAEAYRLLRTNLQFATLATGSSVTIVVSSPEPQDGKTTTAANLGVSLAQTGKRVLLVDTDLRRPALHTHFGLHNDTGLTSLFLQQEPDPSGVIRETGVKGLRLLTSGPIPANPAEVLEYPQFAAILARLQESADYVILDSPPVLSVADASILGQKASGVLLVARPEKTRRESLKASVLGLQKVKVRVLGVVLNNVNHHAGHEYGYAYARHGSSTQGGDHGS